MPGDGNADQVASTNAQRQAYIIDDDNDVRKSLHFLLAAKSITAWPFATSVDFIDHLPDLQPAPVLLDIRMPDIDGLQVLSLLRERAVTWPVIVITAHADVTIAVRAMKLGAIEFLEKPFAPEMLDQALDQAFGILRETELAQRARNDALRLIDGLSKREREIVTIMLEGVPNKLIAHRLGLSTRTVEMHRGNALAKLGAKSILEVVALMETAGLHTPVAPLRN